MPGILVVGELKDGKLKKGTREALSIARKLGEKTGGEVAVFLAGPGASQAASDAAGATKAYVVEDASLGQYSTEGYTAALQQVIDQAQPTVLLIPGTSNGRDLAPRIAARLGVGVASDVIALEWNGDRLRARRPVYSGKAFATVELDGTPAIVTTRPNAFPIDSSTGSAPAVVNVAFKPSAAKAKVVETRTPEAGELSIAEADIIVSGGRGLKEAANFSLIRDLALALGGAVGASRATVDAGWIDHQHQVGQTGRVVGPNLYIAAGVSGAIQHLAGMSTSKHIVAINKDPEAPIFRIADLGIVGDLFTIVPALTEAVKKAKAAH
jgi:electron transfer flavoprotein alpha subunit